MILLNLQISYAVPYSAACEGAYFNDSLQRNKSQGSLLWPANSLPFPKQALVFTCLEYKSFENTMGKGEILATNNFSFSHSVFYPFE